MSQAPQPLADIGPLATFQPGDRVFAAYPGSLRSHVRVPCCAAAMIPPKLPFADTCLTVPYYVAAYHALSEIGLVTQQDNVLIHDGASRLGQALLGLLASRGVTKIWTTAATGEESMWLSESLGLSEAAIIPENWFSFNSSASSQWKQKFSLMISEAEGGSSSLLMSYGKPDGRNVMSQADPTSANSTQPGNAQNS